MTYEELKAEAKAQGYNLIKIKKKEQLLPCTCGCQRRVHLSSYNFETRQEYIILRCYQCGKRAKGTSEADAVHEWNKMIRGETDESRENNSKF